MVIQPKVRGFICTTAHPVGCALHVQEQIDYVLGQPRIAGPKKVLVIGSSTGYGLASRIAATFGCGADTLGICFERPAEGDRTATAGWYNTAAFERAAQAHGRVAKTINGDAYSDDIKQQAVSYIRTHFGQVDMVVYSLASPRRTHPKTGELFSSVIKPIGKTFTDKTVNFHTGNVSEVSIEPASEDEITQTIAVMGGEDWKMWMETLTENGVLAHDATTVAYSYVGPKLTFPIYREGTIGRAKDDLEATAKSLNETLGISGGRAYVSVNKALVTQSSSAIPVVPLYMSLLFKDMKAKELHEDCIEQMYRLFAHRLYADTQQGVLVDEHGLIRLDEREMRDDVQSAVAAAWKQVNTENLERLSDIEGYRQDFLRLFGFGFPGVNYDEDVSPEVHWL